MSDLIRVSILSNYRAQLVAMLPRLTAAQLMRFDDLVASDRVVADDGEPHPALEQWVAGVVSQKSLEVRG